MPTLEPPSTNPPPSPFFTDIEALHKALDLDSKPLRRTPASRSLSSSTNPFTPSISNPKPKKPSSSSSSSLWNWKPLKALSHIRHRRRFECIFSLRIHSIDNLPPSLSDATLRVHWRRVSPDSPPVATRPAAVLRGSANFDESLKFQCSVYGIRSRAQGFAKYEARNFLVYAAVVGSPGLDLGKHRVDLTRLLPVNLDELEDGRSTGNWNTVFRLCGKATGATLSVCFGFSVVGGDDNVYRLCGNKMNSMVFSEKRDRMSRVTGFVDDVKTSVDVVSDLKIDEPKNSAEMKCCVSSQGLDSVKRNVIDFKESESTMVEHKQVIMNEGDYVKRKLNSESVVMKGGNQNEVMIGAAMSEQGEVEEAGEIDILLSQLEEMGYEETNVDDSVKLHVGNVELGDKEGSMKTQSHSLDEFTEEVASEFLSMLDLEHYSSDSSREGGLESPRKQLWKQFKTESSVFSDCLFGLDVDEEMSWGDSCSGVFDFSAIACDADSENQCLYDGIESKSNAQILEDAETEALLREWGLDEKVFDGSPPGSMTGFGSPIHLSPEEPPMLPPLCENLGPFVQTKDGGFLRSMSPNLFKTNSKSNGNLIMQVSKPVVMPAEMGSDNTEILQHLASIGVEKLSMQASKLMPLEEITGGLMQKLAFDSVSDVEEHQSQDSSLHLNHEEDDYIFDLNTSEMKGNHISMTPVRSGESTDEYVSLEDLAPLAMDKIEALSIEGLKIQSGMSDEEAPSNITKKFVGEVPGFKGKEVGDLTSLGLEGAVGLHLLHVEDNGDDVDGLMGLSISLDEWMQLDMGIVKEECELSDRTSKILAAHHAKSTEFSGRGRRDDRRGKNASKKRGLLENNFTVALMVQLRDPFRNYEPVGTPMLALVQVERVFLPPKPKIYSTVLEKSGIEGDIESDTDLEPGIKLGKEDFVDVVPQFKVADVHVAGLKTESGKKKRHWGSPIQQQSGSRWLLANGMGKLNKHPLMKSNAGNKISQLSAKVQPEETLWSISSRVHDNRPKWNEVPASKPHIRNPSFLFFR